MIFLKCVICGFQWKAQLGIDPKRCASKACRSLRWKDGADGRRKVSTTEINANKPLACAVDSCNH